MNAGEGDGLLGGEALRDAFLTAAATLRRDAAAIDAINVYPVPDGDTGSNMAATLQEAVQAALLASERPSPDEVLQAIARGALYGARGNSGVILSQALRGFAAGAAGTGRLDAARVAAGLQTASEAAYRAVARPVEGTMLTVLRAAAAGATELTDALPNGGAAQPCAPALRAAIEAAAAAEARTIEQLPALREAGVPDSGGEGICSLLRGLMAGITGQPAPVTDLPALSLAGSAAHGEGGFGYCTEFLLKAEGTPLDAGRVRALAGGDERASLVVVGDADALHVHVHTADPDALLAGAGALGRVTRVKVDDMSAQHDRFGREGSGAKGSVAILALSPGTGFDAIFEGLGASVLRLDETAKPAAGQIALAADRLRRPDVIVLPNHKDVLMAAGQAAGLATCTIHVVPSTSLPQGIAAALASAGDEAVAENTRRMSDALKACRTVEVTVAAGDRHVAGVAVREGQPIALVDGVLVAAEATLTDALIAGLRRAGVAAGALVTVYRGASAGGDEPRVAEAFPMAEVEWVEGGQVLYPYIASIE